VVQIIIRDVRRFVVFALAAVWLVARPAHAADVTDRVVRTVAHAPGRPIRIDATIADLRIVGSNRVDVEIEVVRHAPSAADLRTFPAVIDDAPGVLRIGVVQQADGRDPALRSEITIRAPAGALFESVRVFEGHVVLDGLRQACDVDLRRGPIEASHLAGRIRLETGVGAIDVKGSELTAGGMMRLRVFNGLLRVQLVQRPENARILAVTFHGRVTSDIPLTMKDQFGPRFGETTIGTGEPVMSLDAVNGDIAITVESRR
jgi:hypothetical protein